MKLAALALLAVAVATPAAGQVRNDYQAGVEARLAGDAERAADLLRRVVTSEPLNADAQLQLGLALLALNRLDEAEGAFRRTLELAPAYADARIGLARVEQRRGNAAAALAALEPVDPTSAEAAELRQRISAGASEAKWRLDIDGSYSAIDEQADWREGSIRLAHRASAATLVSGGVEISRRFGLRDVYGEMRVDHRFSQALSGYVLAGATPNADFRPEWQIGAGGSVRVAAGANPTVLTLDARQARYSAGDIQTLNPGVEQYVMNGRAWLSARWINLFDEDGEHRGGWLVRGDWMTTPRLRLFLGASDAPDVTEGVVTDTFSLFGGLSYDVGDDMVLRASLAHEDRSGGADRLQFGLGAGWKF